MNRRGFTILELLLVVALMVILAAMTWPAIEAMYGDVRLSAAGDQIRGQWAEARNRAIEDLRPYRFGIVPGTGQFVVAPYDDGTTTLAGADYMGEDEQSAPPLHVEDTLPTGVLFGDGGSQVGEDAGDGYSTVVVFRSDGTADRDVEIIFRSEGNRPLQLKLRGLTGAVTSQWLTAEK